MDDSNRVRQDHPGTPRRWPIVLLGASACAAAALTWFPPAPEPEASSPFAAQQALSLPSTRPAIARPSLASGQARPIYRYSVIPGGIATPDDLARAMRTDRVAAAHYGTFDVRHARVVAATARAVHVSYRKAGKIYWTARKVMLAEGEPLLTDGHDLIRARCGNRISEVPRLPVEAGTPDERELDATESDPGGHVLTTSAAAIDEAPGVAAPASGTARGSAAAGPTDAANPASSTAAGNRARQAAGMIGPGPARMPTPRDNTGAAAAAIAAQEAAVEAVARNALQARAAGRRVTATRGGASATGVDRADSPADSGLAAEPGIAIVPATTDLGGAPATAMATGGEGGNAAATPAELAPALPIPARPAPDGAAAAPDGGGAGTVSTLFAAAAGGTPTAAALSAATGATSDAALAPALPAASNTLSVAIPPAPFSAPFTAGQPTASLAAFLPAAPALQDVPAAEPPTALLADPALMRPASFALAIPAMPATTPLPDTGSGTVPEPASPWLTVAGLTTLALCRARPGSPA